MSGTLRTAKKHKVLTYDEEFLMHPVHDGVPITLLKQSIPDSTLETYTLGQVKEDGKMK